VMGYHEHIWFHQCQEDINSLYQFERISGNIPGALEYFFFSIDSSEARKQYDEYCLSIMQTITYAHDRTHFQCTTYTNFWSIINSLYQFERISGNIPGAYVTSHFHKLYKVSPFAPKLKF
jgi:hypothetical protein